VTRPTPGSSVDPVRHTLAGLAAIIALGVTQASASDRAIVWATDTRSPVPAADDPLDPLERASLQQCGAAEARLGETARAVLARKVQGLAIPEIDEVEFLQRASGEPHPWPRVWTVVASPAPEAALRKLDAWLAEQQAPGRRRCGVASGVGPDGRRVVAVVAVDALADLAPLPTRARAGQWLEVEARLRVRARGGKVIILGPSGAPRPLPTAFDGVTLRARFAPERPGEFAVQVLADVDGGPRPVLEASVFADAEPPSSFGDRVAPGEDAEGPVAAVDDDERLFRMLSTARADAGLRSLVRDPRLDALARSHARRMAAGHDLSHDAGDGSPVDRLRAAGLDARDFGENVAHAPAVALAHRALWASPSHRANLLGAEFDRIGVGVARDERGDAWVAETFAGALR
jgi:Cysteine-rich secretory protein family